MMTLPIRIAFFALFVHALTACSAPAQHAAPDAAPHHEVAAEPSAAADSASPDAPSDKSTALEVTIVTEARTEGIIQTPTTVSHTAAQDALTIQIARMRGTCAPAPRYSAQATGDTVTLILLDSDQPKAKCPGHHAQTLKLTGVNDPGAITKVQIVYGDKILAQTP